MKIENKNIDIFHHSDLNKTTTSCKIFNSIIKTIDFDLFESDTPILIENCIIYDFLVHSCWFKEGLIFKNNLVINYIDYQMGGHNEKPIDLSGNIFTDFVSFFDCQFNFPVNLHNNIFRKGSNLLGNLDEGFKNIFDNGIIINGNIGDIYQNGFGK